MRTIGLQDRFRGCLLGAAIGDIAGAAVEAESPAYIERTYGSVDAILRTATVEEFAGPAWQVGRYTDDTQMMLCVAAWLLEGRPHSAEQLLARFAEAYQPWRRYGPATEGILRLYPQHRADWRELATASFPHGSYGNGSAMRVAPVGLAYRANLATVAEVAMESSRPTHSHPWAYQGAVLQATAVAVAAGSIGFDAQAFLAPMHAQLARFSELLWDVEPYTRALREIETGLARGAACRHMAHTLGTGASAQEAVPMALYCFLHDPSSYAQVIHNAVFLGGDTDTIACMAGAISGAYLGASAIPVHWMAAVREEEYSAAEITKLADRLHERYGDT